MQFIFLTISNRPFYLLAISTMYDSSWSFLSEFVISTAPSTDLIVHIYISALAIVVIFITYMYYVLTTVEPVLIGHLGSSSQQKRALKTGGLS